MASSKKPKYPVETPEESKISLTELANNPESRTPIIVCVHGSSLLCRIAFAIGARAVSSASTNKILL